MARIQGRYFSMDADRLADVVRITGYPADVVKGLALDQDWSEGEEHQAWLNEEDPHGVAEWIEVFPAEAIDALPR